MARVQAMPAATAILRAGYLHRSSEAVRLQSMAAVSRRQNIGRSPVVAAAKVRLRVLLEVTPEARWAGMAAVPTPVAQEGTGATHETTGVMRAAVSVAQADGPDLHPGPLVVTAVRRPVGEAVARVSGQDGPTVEARPV